MRAGVNRGPQNYSVEQLLIDADAVQKVFGLVRATAAYGYRGSAHRTRGANDRVRQQAGQLYEIPSIQGKVNDLLVFDHLANGPCLGIHNRRGCLDGNPIGHVAHVQYHVKPRLLLDL